MSPVGIPGLPIAMIQDESRRVVLITGHRRENFGQAFENICQSILTLANYFPDVEFVYPVHLNPNVRDPVFRFLSHNSNIHLIEPLDYLPFIALMHRSHLILTDSGGVQEEAPSLGKPVLVMRESTERSEGIAAGTVRIVGSDPKRIVDEVKLLLSDQHSYQCMAKSQNPYGDGRSSERILELLSRYFEKTKGVCRQF